MESPFPSSEVGEDLVYLEADAIKMKLKGTFFGRKASPKSFIIQFSCIIAMTVGLNVSTYRAGIYSSTCNMKKQMIFCI